MRPPQKTSSPRRPPALVLWVVGGGLIVLLIAIGVAVQQGMNAPGSGPTATPAPAAAWTPPDCGSVQFGAPLAPQPGKQGLRSFSEAPAMQIDVSKKYLVRIKTLKGAIELCLDPQLAPQTVNNFVFLTRNKFYDGLTFHRVEPGFVVQGGDPKGDGSGGPGYTIAEEPVKGEYIDGAVAMAKAQAPHTTGSQFFIDIDDNRAKLTKLYSLFGFVSKGLDVAKKIAVGDVMQTVTVQQQT